MVVILPKHLPSFFLCSGADEEHFSEIRVLSASLRA
jgi:hypothetical protein